MKVRMKTLYAGPAGSFQPGAVASFDAETARALVSGGYATPLDEKPAPSEKRVPEAAMSGPAENTALPHVRSEQAPSRREIKHDKKR